MIKNVLPAIKEKFPKNETSRTVYIQRQTSFNVSANKNLESVIENSTSG